MRPQSQVSISIRPRRRTVASLAALLLAALPVAVAAAPHKKPPPPAPPQAPAPPAPATPEELATAKLQRLQLPGVGGKPFFYTIAVPEGWMVYEEAKIAAGMWVGPPGAVAGDPRMVYVRVATTSLASAEAAAASLRRADAADQTWSAPSIEIKEVGTVRGLLVQIETGQGARAQSTLSLRLPLPNRNSAEFWFAANRYDFAKLRPFYERVLLSVLPFK
ncbi:MAG TPA: hypothetical protein VGE98_00350 [Thermoanaerobaculia bacterium]